MMCGITCLNMICKYYNHSFNEHNLTEANGTTSNGISLLSLKNYAEELGFTTSCELLSVKILNTRKMPCILHWNQNHFVVVTTQVPT